MSYLDEHYDEIFKKYTNEELLKDIDSYQNGKGRLSKVLNHFFKENIFESIAPRGNKSPMDALNNDEDMKFILNYISTKPNFYTGKEVANVESFFRNAGRLAQKVANFCPKNARDIYWRYFEKGEKINILDTSMGFGSRMSAALLSGGNYCGFDPNKKLFSNLKEYSRFLKEHNIIEADRRVGLYCDGSENFHKELCNLFDVSFTSPPYFDYEIYSNDEKQSCKKHDTYENWVNYFVVPTVKNTYEYLKIGGYAMINIKNLTHGKRYPLFDDFMSTFKQIDGFEFVEIFEMEHQAKKNYTMNTNYSEEQYKGFKESVMVFRKVK